MLQGGNQFLRLDNPDPANFSWITYKTDFSFADGNELSYASDVTFCAVRWMRICRQNWGYDASSVRLSAITWLSTQPESYSRNWAEKM